MRGKLEFNVAMAPYTTWRVGGRADRAFWPADKEDLAAFFAQRDQDEPIYFIGLGSNLLIRDGGLRGTALMLHTSLNNIEVREGNILYAEAGVPCAKVAKVAAKHGLEGLAFFAGIPGTVGGALAMNAGAFGGETWPLVKSVDICRYTGELATMPASEFSYGYRTVSGAEDCCFVGAEFALSAAETTGEKKAIKALLAERAEKQPLGAFSCGSVFKNPEGDFSARLIEAAGLKGYRIGGAVISEKHANFILNDDRATAADIEALIELAKQTVAEKFNINLQVEAKIVGEAVNDE